MHVTDTPGTEALNGVGKRENRKRYLSEVSKAYRKADIMLYCIRMDDCAVYALMMLNWAIPVNKDTPC